MTDTKLDRRHTLRNQITAVLEAHPDGLSVSEIARLIAYSTTYNGVRQSLLGLANAYIDRWRKDAAGPHKAIWCLSDKCIVDCPKPRGYI